MMVLTLCPNHAGNNCDCSDHCTDPYKTGGQCESQIKGDVNALARMPPPLPS